MKAAPFILTAIFLAGCAGSNTGPGKTDSSTQREAEATTDRDTNRTTRLEVKPMVDEPELDATPAVVTAGGVSTTIPAGMPFTFELDERDAATTSSKTTDSTATRTVLEQARKTPVAVYIGGAILVAAGAVLAIAFGRIMWGLALAAAGVGCVAVVVAINVYPWVGLVAVLLGLGGAAFVLYDAWERGREREATKTIVGGIERLDKSTRERVVAEIGDKHKTGEKARARTKAVVGKVKRDLGIG